VKEILATLEEVGDNLGDQVLASTGSITINESRYIIYYDFEIFLNFLIV